MARRRWHTRAFKLLAVSRMAETSDVAGLAAELGVDGEVQDLELGAVQLVDHEADDPLAQLGHPSLERLSTRDHLALRRGQRTQLAPARTAAHVRGRLLGANSRHLAFDSHLPPQRLPVE